MSQLPKPPDAPDDEQANPEWFREPTRREHRIGAALFTGFGIFWVILFAFQRGWWFRWFLLLLGILSLLRGLRHGIGAVRGKRP